MESQTQSLTAGINVVINWDMLPQSVGQVHVKDSWLVVSDHGGNELQRMKIQSLCMDVAKRPVPLAPLGAPRPAAIEPN